MTEQEIESFKKILFSGRSRKRWKALCRFIPELRPNRGLKQNKKTHPEGCVDDHICAVIDNVARLNDINMSLVALFHDIGKACVHKSFKKDDGETRISHASHEFYSTRIVKKYEKLINDCGAFYPLVYHLVLNHSKANTFVSGDIKKEEKRQDFQNQPFFPEMIIFAKANNETKKKPEKEKEVTSTK